MMLRSGKEKRKRKTLTLDSQVGRKIQSTAA
jgi:hypothetical protein